MKKLLFFCYGSICEPYLINSFQRIGYEVTTIKTIEMNMQFQPEEILTTLKKLIDQVIPEFVFSIDFYPQVSSVCQERGILYLSYTVNVPINTLFCKELQNETNRTFLFDHTQFEQFSPRNQNCIYHLPLASPVSDLEEALKKATEKQKNRFSGEISFVGSLYTQSDQYPQFVPYLSDYTKGYLNGLMEAQLKIPGGLFLKECIRDKMVEEFKRLSPDLSKGPDDPKYVLTHYLIGKHLAVLERQRYLCEVADKYPLNLFTNSSEKLIPGAKLCGQVDSYQEMPIVFANSKINLNITYRAIETGLPQRIWDVLGCGGFLLTTFSEEIPEYFTIGEDLDIFTCEEELIDKIDFYLKQDVVRQKIAKNGYEKVKKYHTYEIRLKRLLEIAGVS